MTTIWVLGLIASAVAVFTPGAGWLTTGLRVLAIVVGLLVLGGMIQQAHAQPQVHALSRICVGEAGWDRGPDCPAIWAVLDYRSAVRGSTWLSAARAYSPGHLGLREGRQRPWIAHLRPGGWQPRGWPAALPWRRYRGRWLRMVEYARQIVAGDVRPPCSPHHWGARYGVDLRRAHRAGWREVDCSVDGVRTRNAFWRVD